MACPASGLLSPLPQAAQEPRRLGGRWRACGSFAAFDNSYKAPRAAVSSDEALYSGVLPCNRICALRR